MPFYTAHSAEHVIYKILSQINTSDTCGSTLLQPTVGRIRLHNWHCLTLYFSDIFHIYSVVDQSYKQSLPYEKLLRWSIAQGARNAIDFIESVSYFCTPWDTRAFFSTIEDYCCKYVVWYSHTTQHADAKVVRGQLQKRQVAGTSTYTLRKNCKDGHYKLHPNPLSTVNTVHKRPVPIATGRTSYFKLVRN